MSKAALQSPETAVLDQVATGLRYERFLGLFVRLRQGEGRCVLLFFTHAFLLLVCYYILKTLREPLLLVDASPELKSYAYATVALVLLVLVPSYSAVFRRLSRTRISSWITVFFVVNIAVFYSLGRMGADIGFVYYVWVGVFGVTILAQFWAHAADAFNVQSGQRLFPAIMAAAALGGLVGPSVVGTLFIVFGPWLLMLIAGALLAATLPLIGLARNAVPNDSRSISDVSQNSDGRQSTAPRPCGGFGLVFGDRYLLLLAILMVLLNCVNTTGEYLLTGLVVDFAAARVALDATLDEGAIIAAFYGSYYLSINLLTVLAQLFIVSRLIRWIGVHGALLVVPAIVLLGYGLVVFLPVFSVLRLVKILENSSDYSVMNTSRQALYLPLSANQKYQGKIAIDTFFYRFGDLLQAGVIFVGLNVLHFEFRHFAIFNACLAVVWFYVALQLAGLYVSRTTRTAQGLLRSPFVCIRAGLASIARSRLRWHRNLATALLTAMLGLSALTASAPIEAADAGLFDDESILELDVFIDLRALCRNPARKRCDDQAATLVYVDRDGQHKRVETSVRSRGRYRKDTIDCRLPALFVFFGQDTAGTLFAGQEMLPLTTHCKPSRAKYEHYVLKEYLAYRIYNLLTEKSLRVRLARITYHDPQERHEPLTRFGFFTEHFDSLAARHDSQVVDLERWDPNEANPNDLATHDLFQYLIGNTDFSVIYGHNIVHIENEHGLVTPVPYDFDFAGLVNTEYASPPPNLPIPTVRQRLFRGICRADIPWESVTKQFQSREQSILDLVHASYEPADLSTVDDTAYIDAFFAILQSPKLRAENLSCRCRSTDVAFTAHICHPGVVSLGGGDNNE